MCFGIREEGSMSENIRVTSTAKKISGAWLRRLIWIFFRLNLVLLILAVLSFCLYNEFSALGSDWELSIRRELDFGGHVSDPSLVSTVKNFVVFLPDSDYVFYSPSGLRHSVPLRDYLFLMMLMGGCLLIAEASICIGQSISGRKTARKLLRPLDRMAKAAQELGRSAAHPQSFPADAKIHDLEDAIGRISPDRPDARLQTGDQDLQGLEDAINAMLTRMHDSYRQQARFVSDASHELRTPIAVIQGYAGMLDRWGKQDEKILEESIGAIRSEADYMNHLIEQLLFLARGDTGRNRMDFKPVSLDALMQEVYDDFRLIDQSHDWRICASEGTACTGDWDMLKQCVRILADNAMKYTPENGLIQLKAYTGPDGNPRIQVQDSGIGISGEDAQHIFDRFYRSDPARSRSSGGTGLGLSIAAWIVERHGGHFDLISRQGVGTRMTVCLPKSKPDTGDRP